MLDSNGKAKMFGLLGLLAVGAVGLTGCQNAIQNDPVTCKVIDKDRSTGKDGGSVFRIYTEGGEECTTFGLADNWLQGNFNASDDFGKIEVGATYEFETVGVRNGFFSLFPEIVSFEKAS